MITYFISDLHLQENEFKTANLFFKFLTNQAMHADAVYILGDFFNLWVGDDIDSIFIQKIKHALTTLTQVNKVPVYFLLGNRDFLLGPNFFKQTGCILLPDPVLVTLYNQAWLLSHGDIFIADKHYARFRSILRNKWLIYLFLCLPIKFRLQIAKKLRKTSKNNYQTLLRTDPAALDIDQQLILNALLKYKVYNLIHGHTHKPGIHKFTIGTTEATRIVLGSWEEQAKILTCTATGYNLETISV